VYRFKITASNASGVMMQTFTLTVDQAPAITSAGTATFVAGQTNSFTVTTSGLPAGQSPSTRPPLCPPS